MTHRVRNWWWEVIHNDWPYELPEEKKWWVPAWLNTWLGNRSYSLDWLARPTCWRKGHAPSGYGDCARCGRVYKNRPRPTQETNPGDDRRGGIYETSGYKRVLHPRPTQETDPE